MGLPPPPPPGPPSVLGCTVLSPTLPQVRRQSRLWLYLPHPRTAGLSRLHRPGLLRAPARDHRSMEQCQVDGGEASPACPSPPASLRATRAKKQGSASGHRRPPALLPGARGVQPRGALPCRTWLFPSPLQRGGHPISSLPQSWRSLLPLPTPPGLVHFLRLPSRRPPHPLPARGQGHPVLGRLVWAPRHQQQHRYQPEDD